MPREYCEGQVLAEKLLPRIAAYVSLFALAQSFPSLVEIIRVPENPGEAFVLQAGLC